MSNDGLSSYFSMTEFTMELKSTPSTPSFVIIISCSVSRWVFSHWTGFFRRTATWIFLGGAFSIWYYSFCLMLKSLVFAASATDWKFISNLSESLDRAGVDNLLSIRRVQLNLLAPWSTGVISTTYGVCIIVLPEIVVFMPSRSAFLGLFLNLSYEFIGLFF